MSKEEKYFIEIRRVADPDVGLIMENRKRKEFTSEKKAREWARENLEGTNYLAMWQPISRQQAIRSGYTIN